MFDAVRNRLTERIVSDYHLGVDNARLKAEQICHNCPEQLRPNVEQYALGSKITDIYVGQYSIPMIMAIWGNQDFIGALDVITQYLNGDPDIAEHRIWRMRR